MIIVILLGVWIIGGLLLGLGLCRVSADADRLAVEGTSRPRVSTERQARTAELRLT